MQVAGIYSVAGIYTLKKVADNRVVTLEPFTLTQLKYVTSRIHYLYHQKRLLSSFLLRFDFQVILLYSTRGSVTNS